MTYVSVLSYFCKCFIIRKKEIVTDYHYYNFSFLQDIIQKRHGTKKSEKELNKGMINNYSVTNRIKNMETDFLSNAEEDETNQVYQTSCLIIKLKNDW